MGMTRRLVWLMGAMTWAACSGSTSTTGGGTTTAPVPQSQFAAKFSQSICAAMANCCRDNALTYDATTCTNGLRAQLDSALVRYASLDLSYDAEAAAACIDAYSSVLRACTGSLSGADDSCGSIFVGHVPVGGACQESVECEKSPGQDVYCDAGECVIDSYVDPTTTPGALGDACAGTCTVEDDGSGYACSSTSAPTGNVYCLTNDGLACDSSTGACTQLPALGEACVSDCAGDAYCDAGTCAGRRTSGPCLDDRACVATAYCDSTSQECLPQKPNGQACEGDGQCQGGDCNNGICANRIPVDDALCVGLLN